MPSIYETDKLLAEYLLFHYGAEGEILPPGRAWPAGMREALEFPQRTVAHFAAGPVARGLDLGCAVGRSTFEMARTCAEVTGIDFSHAFIRAAEALRRGDALAYQRLEEGRLHTELLARRPAGVAGENVRFCQGDALQLPAGLGSFDRVHAANLLCRLREPQRAGHPVLVARGVHSAGKLAAVRHLRLAPGRADSGVFVSPAGRGAVPHPRDRPQVPVDQLAGERLAARGVRSRAKGDL